MTTKKRLLEMLESIPDDMLVMMREFGTEKYHDVGSVYNAKLVRVHTHDLVIANFDDLARGVEIQCVVIGG